MKSDTLAALSGYQVTVIDPRRAFATDSRFPDVAMTGDWPDDAMTALAPDRRTAVVALTHDPKLDDPGLDATFRPFPVSHVRMVARSGSAVTPWRGDRARRARSRRPPRR